MLPVLLLLACGDPGTEPDPAKDPKPVAIALSPSDATLSFIGETAVFTATVTDQFGAPFDASVVWTGDSDDVFSVTSSSSGNASAVAKAVANGSGTITASFQNLSATASVTVAQAPTTALVSSGADQEGLPGANLAELVSFRVNDRGGAPVPRLVVRFAPNDDHGSADPDSANTDVNGEAATLWTLGSKVGPQILTASVPGGPRVRVTATGSFGSAIEPVAGERQRALPGIALRDPIVVRVLDKHGNAMAGTTVLFAPEPGEGAVTADSVIADGAGEAAVVWTLGDSVGTQRLNASVPFGPGIQITATGLSGLGVCDRTPQVRDALVEATGRRHCTEVTQHQLGRITSFPPRGYFWWSGVTGLYDDDFAGLTGLEHLDLSTRHGSNDGRDWRQLSELPPKVFSDLSNLKSLNLSRNKLQTVPEGVLSSLTKLEHLSLVGNSITELPPRIFQNLTKLRVLKVSIGTDGADSHSQDPEYHAEIADRSLVGLSPLAALEAFGSYREAIQARALLQSPQASGSTTVASPSPGSFPVDLFWGLVNLDTLWIETGFSDMPPDALRGPSSLRSLEIHGPLSVSEGLLSGMVGIERLFLAVSEIAPNAFQGLTSLAVLGLHGPADKPIAIPEPLLWGLGNLNSLRLTVSAIAPGALRDLTSLRSLEIGGTAHSLPRLDHMTVLENLSLNGLPLTTIEPHNIPASPKLTSLNITHTKIRELPARVFSNANQLETIGFNWNADLIRLDPLAFADLAKLEGLNLWGAKRLQSLPAGVFAGLHELRWIWFEGVSGLETIDSGVFTDLPSLEQLAMGAGGGEGGEALGKLTKLPPLALSNLTNLTLLWFNGFPIEDLPSRALSGKSRLRWLELLWTRIPKLHPGTFEGVTALTRATVCKELEGGGFPLHVSLRRTDSDSLSAPAPARIVVAVTEGTPFDVPIVLSASSGSLSADTTTVPAGSVVSDTITVTASAGDTTGVVLSMQLLPPNVQYGGCGFNPSSRQPYYVGLRPQLADPITLFR